MPRKPWNHARDATVVGLYARGLKSPSARVQVETLADTAGLKVSLIGWSLGGIFARELAFKIADRMRLVITLASPKPQEAWPVRGL
jgi:pimeloyl-ACP methyl ester carboxylesterase